MPENARVFIVEDSDSTRRSLTAVLEVRGHQVVAQTANLEDAKAAIESFNTDSIDVTILDGNLTEGDVSCNDGRLLYSLLKEKLPNTPVISFSSRANPGFGDIEVNKRQPPEVLLDTIKSI